ncbi:MAG: hypothetical protein ACK5NF_07240 [Bacilli bacterium]
MNVYWYKENQFMFVKINKNCIILNSHASKQLSDYAYCRLGINKLEKKIYIQPVSYDEYDNNKTDYSIIKINHTRSYSRVNCTDFINTINSKLNLDFNQEKKLNAQWDDKEKLFVINLEAGGDNNARF